MPAGIEFRGDKPMFAYAGEVPWHGIGKGVTAEMKAGEAIVEANMDHEYLKMPAQIVFDDETKKYIPGLYAVVRDFDRRPVGHVGKNYRIIQPRECFDFLDELVGSGQAFFHTAGEIHDGQVIFITLKLPQTLHVGPDTIEEYLLLSNVFNGQQSLHLRWTPVRVVCQNTYGLAIAQQKVARSISIPHVEGYEAKIKEARRVLELTEVYYKAVEVQFNRLLQSKFPCDQMVNFLAKLFPDQKQVDGTAKTTPRTVEIRSEVLELFYDGAGQKEVKETRWAALNAVTDFVDHKATLRPRRGTDPQEARMRSAIFGTGADLRQRAFDLLTVDLN